LDEERGNKSQGGLFTAARDKEGFTGEVVSNGVSVEAIYPVGS
jgi:hypothetical protein